MSVDDHFFCNGEDICSDNGVDDSLLGCESCDDEDGCLRESDPWELCEEIAQEEGLPVDIVVGIVKRLLFRQLVEGGMTVAAVAEWFGLSSRTVFDIEKSALRKLRVEFEGSST